jgi:predicted O-methyltransferase YrrM
LLSSLEGLIPDAVGERLAELASFVPPEQAIVEIGSYKGKSTSYLATGAMNGLRAAVHAVDPWDTPGNAGGRFGFDRPDTFKAFQAQIARAGVLGWVTPHKGFSADVAKAWTGPRIGLLYVDGSHTEADVAKDWAAWSPRLAPGAVVAFDDYETKNNPGVARVVNRLGGRLERGPYPLVIRWP